MNTHECAMKHLLVSFSNLQRTWVVIVDAYNATPMHGKGAINGSPNYGVDAMYAPC